MPEIDSITPASSPFAPGSFVVTGNELDSVGAVSLRNEFDYEANGYDIVRVSAHELRFEASFGATGTYQVTLYGGGGENDPTASDHDTITVYSRGTTTLTPDHGPIEGGNTVVIANDYVDFSAVATVSFGDPWAGGRAAEIVSRSAHSITLIAPNGYPQGTVVFLYDAMDTQLNDSDAGYEWEGVASPTPVVTTPACTGPTPTPFVAPTPFSGPTPRPHVGPTPTPCAWPAETPAPGGEVTPAPVTPTPAPPTTVACPTPTPYAWPTPSPVPAGVPTPVPPTPEPSTSPKPCLPTPTPGPVRTPIPGTPTPQPVGPTPLPGSHTPTPKPVSPTPVPTSTPQVIFPTGTPKPGTTPSPVPSAFPSPTFTASPKPTVIVTPKTTPTPTPAPVVTPVITHVIPGVISAGKAWPALITGSGFAKTATVTIGGRSAKVALATKSVLFVVFPALPKGTYPVSVTSLGRTSAASTVARVTVK